MQSSDSPNFYSSGRSRILLDIDNTIAQSNKNLPYADLEIYEDILEASYSISEKLGFDLDLYTARNMRSFSGDRQMIIDNMLPILQKWLNDKQVEYSRICIGKEWPGPLGFYVDDRSLTPYELLLKAYSLKYFPSVSIAVSMYNEYPNILHLWRQLLEVSKVLNVTQIVLVDNGSTDDSFSLLEKLSLSDSRVVIFQNPSGSSYSEGFSKAVSLCDAEYILTSHSDLQINIDHSIRGWLDNLYQSDCDFLPRITLLLPLKGTIEFSLLIFLHS